jgi:P22 coat protein - gene protein 5
VSLRLLRHNDYEGEIAGPGDAVHITQFGDPTISSYTPGGTIQYQALTDAGLTLYFDQAKSFSFAIDDVDRRQAAGDMQAYLEGRAAYQMANVADQFIASLYTGVAQANIMGTLLAPLTPQPYGGLSAHPADALIQVLEPAKVILDQNNVPDDDRYIICPPWFVSLLSQTQAFLSVTDMQGNPSQVFQRGFEGQVSGFNVLKSNNVPLPGTFSGTVGGVTYTNAQVNAVQFGHPMGITYGEQITQTEALRLQTTIADGVRGLHVYGAKMTRADVNGVCYIARPPGI